MFIYIACNHDHHMPYHHMHHLHNDLHICIITGSQEESVAAEEVSQEGPAQEVPAEEDAVEELQECLNHHPSSFERGKPLSISPSICRCLTYALIMFDALSLGVDCNRCCIIPCLSFDIIPLIYPSIRS
jgi:hypothetical protein